MSELLQYRSIFTLSVGVHYSFMELTKQSVRGLVGNIGNLHKVVFDSGHGARVFRALRYDCVWSECHFVIVLQSGELLVSCF